MHYNDRLTGVAAIPLAREYTARRRSSHRSARLARASQIHRGEPRGPRKRTRMQCWRSRRGVNDPWTGGPVTVQSQCSPLQRSSPTGDAIQLCSASAPDTLTAHNPIPCRHPGLPAWCTHRSRTHSPASHSASASRPGKRERPTGYPTAGALCMGKCGRQARTHRVRRVRQDV